jgi:branched-chain amino acid transport system substrate-binding protein
LVVNTDYLPGNDATFLQQFLEDPTDSMLFMQYGPSVPEFYDLTKDESTGVIYNLLGGLIQSPKNVLAAKFLELFKNEYGVESGSYGYSLYTEVYIYTEALKIVGNPTDHLAVGKAIGGLTTDSAMGVIKFDPATHLAIQGDDWVPLQFYQLWNGQRILLSPDRFSTGTIQNPPWRVQH